MEKNVHYLFLSAVDNEGGFQSPALSNGVYRVLPNIGLPQIENTYSMDQIKNILNFFENLIKKGYKKGINAGDESGRKKLSRCSYWH